MKTKFYLSLAITTMIFASSNAQQKAAGNKIILKNSSKIALSQKAISIKRSQLSIKDEGAQYPILLYKKDTIPAQVNDLDGDGKWDELFLVGDFAPNESKTLELKWSNKDPKFTIKTSVRFGKREGKDKPVHPDTDRKSVV